jgi:hypothetical protein
LNFDPNQQEQPRKQSRNRPLVWEEARTVADARNDSEIEKTTMRQEDPTNVQMSR